MLIRDAIVPGTQLRARRDVSVTEILRFVGPALGKLYREVVEASDVVPVAARDLRELLEDCFVRDEGTKGESLVREWRDPWGDEEVRARKASDGLPLLDR